jgi:putative GTP pyrophosphokinase
MPSLDFASEREAFKEFYAANASILQDASESLRTLLGLLLADNNDFATPQVVSRVKDRDECIAKFARKYQAHFEESQTPYTIRDTITDIVGLRVIGLYETDVQSIRAVLADNFELVEESDKSQALETQEAVFGYKGLHLDLKLGQSRRDLPEYRRFHDFRFEVQLRTIVQDAWSVLDHKIKYKKSIPHSLKRRINRLAALFELADQEFLNIRDETRRLEEQATVKAEAPPLAQPVSGLDAFLFLGVATSFFPTYHFLDYKIDGFVSELLAVIPTLNSDEIVNALTQGEPVLKEYLAYQYERFRNRLNPYTTIRHALYLMDRTSYSALLFDFQRHTFDSWLIAREEHGGPPQAVV